MKHWLLLLVAGLAAIAGGVLALLNPIAATITATTIVAWLFLFMGGIQIVAAFGKMGTWTRLSTAALGALAVFIGGWILTNPIAGTLALTWVIGILFFVEGVVKLVLAFVTRRSPWFWAMLLSGAVSVLLGGMILTGFPQTAMTIPGILLAVDLISTGVALVGLALYMRRTPAEAVA